MLVDKIHIYIYIYQQHFKKVLHIPQAIENMISHIHWISTTILLRCFLWYMVQECWEIHTTATGSEARFE